MLKCCEWVGIHCELVRIHNKNTKVTPLKRKCHFKEIYITSCTRKLLFYPSAFRPKGYFRCLRPSVRLSFRLSVIFTLSERYIVTDLSWNHQISTKHALCDTLCWYWKYRSLILPFKAVLATLAQGYRKFDFYAINCNGFELESPNWHQICILGFSRLILKLGVIDLDLQCHVAFFTQNSRKLHSTSLVYTDLGRTRGVTRPNVLLW